MKLVEVIDQPEDPFTDDISGDSDRQAKLANAIFYRIEKSLQTLVKSGKINRQNLVDMSKWIVDRIPEPLLRKEFGTSDCEQLYIPASEDFTSNDEAVECIIQYLGILYPNDIIRLSKQFLGW